MNEFNQDDMELNNIADPSGDPLDALIDDEERLSDELQDETDFALKNPPDARTEEVRYLHKRAISFLAEYEAEDGLNSVLEGLGGDPLQRVAWALNEGHIQAEAVVGWLSKFAHQLSKTVFFELYRREQRAARLLEQKGLPTMDRTTQSLRLQAVIAALPRRLSGEHPAQEQTPLNTASENTLTDMLCTEVARCSAMHQEVFRLAFGNYPTRSLGFMCIEAAPDEWIEIDDFFEAKSVFDALQEAKQEAKKVRERTAARGLLAAFAAAKA